MTSNKDTDTLLLRCLKDKDLFSIMRVSKYFYNLTYSNIFWINRTKIRFSFINTEGKECYKYIKRIYPFKEWLTKENFKLSKTTKNSFQRIHNCEQMSHTEDCVGCELCLYADYEIGYKFLGYCHTEKITKQNHFDMKYIQHTNVYEFRNRFFNYKTEEIEKILNL